MIDHISFKVKEFAKSKAFYAAALKPLGYTIAMDFGEAVGMGSDNKPDFWLMPAGDKRYDQQHIAFSARDRKTVDAFYEAALKAGGKDNGKPGIRKDYHPNYYAAFVLDPDGHNIEVVCHKP